MVIDVDTVWFVLRDNVLLLHRDNTLPSAIDVGSMAPYFLRSFQLGRFNNIEYCCAEIDERVMMPDHLQGLSLRQLLSLLHQDSYGMAVKAYSVLSWDRNHQFCSRCGSVTRHQSKSFERICTVCALSFFPRISPSMIVLIRKEDHVLMARSPHYLPGVYGLIAGFVEVGETLEETVHREVREEVGLEIKNLSYVGSQPWPFPDSLMVAFTAEYASGDIVIDQDEIVEAGWYRYDNLPGRPSMGISIAATLLDRFIEACLQTYA